MSKSRGNFLDPIDVVRALGQDGARYVALREVPFDRDADVSWDSFVRRYNADLANDYGNLVNRTVTMTGRYLEGVRPRPTEGALAAAWAPAFARYAELLEGCLVHEALATLWEFVGEANRYVDAQQPWTLAKVARGGGEDAADAAARLRGVLGDLLEACRVVSLAAAPFMPGVAARAAAQLGVGYRYGPDGNGGPPLRELAAWGGGTAGAGAAASDRVGAPEPLFPRLGIEAGEG
jgi:methionyl-tRNA synthetase